MIVLFPVYMTVVQSLLPGEDFFRYPPVMFPMHPSLHAFGVAWTRAGLDRYLFNSAVVSIAIAGAQLTTATLAAYAFTFLRFRFQRVLFAAFIVTAMVPWEATLLPNRATIVAFHWMNTYRALVVPFLATGLGTFLLRQAFKTIPPEFADAAAIDGCGHVRFLTSIVIPVSRPMLAALALFSFLGAWSQYIWPLVVTDSPRRRTVQIGLRALADSAISSQNVRAAGAILAAVPVVVVLVLFQRHVVRGLGAGAVKG